MAAHFQLRVVTPNRPLLDLQVREVTAPGTAGEFGVLPDHITFLTSLEIGVFTFRGDAGTRRIAVRGGFAEVCDNVMTVLADDAVLPEDIDVEACRARVHETEAALKGLSPLDDAHVALDAERRWALARLEAAGRR